MMDTLKAFHNLAKEQFFGLQNKILLPQKNKVDELQSRIYAEKTSGIGAQIIKGAVILGGTMCSSFAASVFFGKKIEEVDPNQGSEEESISRHLLSIPQVKSTLAPVSIFPNNAMPVTALSIDNLFFDSDGQSLTLDVQSIPSWMVLGSSLGLLGSYDTPSNALGVYVAQNLTYIADQLFGLQIIDVSNPISPTLKGTYDTPGTAYGVYVLGNMAYVADYASGLQIIDVGNPGSPALKGTYDTPGTAKGVHVVQNLAYVADGNSGLQIIDVSNPNLPILKGTYDTPGHARNVHVVGNLAYVADYSSGLQIIDVSNSSFPTLKGAYDTPGLASSLYVAQNLVYIADDYSGLAIIDVSNSSSPFLKGTYNTPGNAYGVDVAQNLAYVAAASSGLQIIDVSNSSLPILKGTCSTPGTAQSVYVAQNLTYVADQSGGLQILKVMPALSGTPNQTQVGNYEIAVIARDPDQNEVSQSFFVRVEGSPFVSETIPNQLINVDTPFVYLVEQNVFTDPNNDVIYYSAELINQNPLPSWLSFSSTGVFSGIPRYYDSGTYMVKVSAFDNIVLEQVNTTFSLNVANVLGEELTRIGREFVYAVPNDMIKNPQGPLTYTVTLGSDSPLPAWITFDFVNGVISGTPPSNSQGDYTLLVAANDGVQPKALGTLNLRVDVNAAPQVANLISNQAAQVSQKYRFVVPDNTFIDPNGDTLTLSALKANNQALPTWLKFDAVTRTLAGKPGPGDTGAFSDKVLPLQICATDGNEKACSVFSLSVQGTSNEEQALTIFGPLGSAAAVSLACYKKRGLFINPFNKSKYDKGTKIVPIGQSFTYKLEVDVNKVKLVQAFKGRRILAGIPVPKSLDERGWFEWLKHDRAIRGGALLPSWLQYNEGKNQLSSLNPFQEDAGLYVVQVYGHGDVILEEIKLDVGGQGSKSLEMVEMP